MRILLTNDDGLDAPGITALWHAIKDLGDVTVVAPATVQSATSHSVTLHRPLRVEERSGVEPTTGLDFRGLAVAGYPADCVKLAACELMPPKDGGIDLVISGINAGANIGVHVLYSGTVGAAREASFLGIPSIAVSLHLQEHAPDWPVVAEHARRSIDWILERGPDASTVMNVNIPALKPGQSPKGTKVLPLSTSAALDSYERTDLEDGAADYQLRPALNFYEQQPGTDVAAVFDKWITVTPLHFDLTCEDGLEKWQEPV